MGHFSRNLLSVWLVISINLITISTLASEDHSKSPETESQGPGTNESTFRFTKDSTFYGEIKSLVEAVKNSNEAFNGKDLSNFRLDPETGSHVPIDGLDYESASTLDARKDVLEQLIKHLESMERWKAKITPEDLPLFNQLYEDLKKVEGEFLVVETVLSKLTKIEERLQNLTKTVQPPRTTTTPPQHGSLLALEQSISSFESLSKSLPLRQNRKAIDLSSSSINNSKMVIEIDTMRQLLKDTEKESLDFSAEDKKRLASFSDRAKGLISDWEHLQKAQTKFINQERSSSNLALKELPAGALETALLSLTPPIRINKDESDSNKSQDAAKLQKEINDLRGAILNDIESRDESLGANLDVAYLNAIEKLKEAEAKINQLTKPKTPIDSSAAASAIVGAIFPTLSSMKSALNQVGSAVLGNESSSQSAPPRTPNPFQPTCERRASNNS
jgi:hypothetical protein